MIPCKRPKVEVVPHDNGDRGAFSVLCRVPGCGWTYGTAPYVACKSDALQSATHHRQHHRAAVPATNPDGSCSCGWAPGPGVVTAVDRKAYLDHHLANAHGLVVCS